MTRLNDGAIHKDASNPEDGAIHEDAHEDNQDRQISPREEAMERLAASREVQLNEAVGITPEPDKQAAALEPDTTRMVRVKIDGEEKELPLSDVVKGFQKESTASIRLEQAARERQGQEQREAALLEKEKEITAREEQLKRQAAVVDDPADDAEYDAALDALLEGDRTLMKSILKKGRPEGAAPVTEQDIDKIVDQRLSERQQVETARQQDEAVRDANIQFSKDYPDILGDELLLDAANKRYYAKLAEGKPIAEAMAEAGRETREWLEAKTGKPTARDVKLQRKSTLDNLPTAGARSASMRDLDNTPESPSSIIEGMRKARGLIV